MKQSKSNKITLDDLALMVGKGFNEMNDRMTKGFESLEKKIEKTESTLKTELNKKVDIFTHKSLEIKVEKIEEKMEAINRK